MYKNTKNNYETIQIKTAQEFANTIINCLQMVKKIQLLLNELNSISLSKKQGETFEQYVKLLIETAKREKEYGWERRVAGLNKLLDFHTLLGEIHKNKPITMSYEEFEKEALEYGIKIKSLEDANNIMGQKTKDNNQNCNLF